MPNARRRRASTLDLDARTNPIHAPGRPSFFTAFYDATATCRLRVICGEHLTGVKLRRSNIDASARARPRENRPHRHTHPRAAGQGWAQILCALTAASPAERRLMAWCRGQTRSTTWFGLARNSKRPGGSRSTSSCLGRGRAERARQPARRFADFRWPTRDSWSSARRRGKGRVDAGPAAKGRANRRFRVNSRSPRRRFTQDALLSACTVHAATWRTGIKGSASSTCSATATARRPWSQTAAPWVPSMAYVLPPPCADRAQRIPKLERANLRIACAMKLAEDRCAR